jgi:hypothetical protein
MTDKPEPPRGFLGSSLFPTFDPRPVDPDVNEDEEGDYDGRLYPTSSRNTEYAFKGTKSTTPSDGSTLTSQQSLASSKSHSFPSFQTASSLLVAEELRPLSHSSSSTKGLTKATAPSFPTFKSFGFDASALQQPREAAPAVKPYKASYGNDSDSSVEYRSSHKKASKRPRDRSISPNRHAKKSKSSRSKESKKEKKKDNKSHKHVSFRTNQIYFPRRYHAVLTYLHATWTGRI